MDGMDQCSRCKRLRPYAKLTKGRCNDQKCDYKRPPRKPRKK